MLPEAVRRSIATETEQIRRYAAGRLGVVDPEVPDLGRLGAVEGEATTVAFPILGIEKYLGLSDRENVLAYFPSLSVTHTAARTLCHIRLDPKLPRDILELDGRPLKLEGADPDKEAPRVRRFLERFRAETGLTSKGVCILENSFAGGVRAKGLGLSSSVAAAVARAMVQASFGEAAAQNVATVSRYARWISGSGSRAAAGGLSLWYSYDGIEERRSTAVRIQEVPLRFLVYPKPSRGRTQEAHDAVTRSRFYSAWAQSKPLRIFHLLEEVHGGRLERLGEACETDTQAMHAVLMEAGRVVLDRDAIEIMRELPLLREGGTKAYYSIDTGSSVFVLCFEDPDRVRDRLAPFVPHPPHLCSSPSPEQYRPSPEEEARMRERADHWARTET